MEPFRACLSIELQEQASQAMACVVGTFEVKYLVMKTLLFRLGVLICAVSLFSGCAWHVGGGAKNETVQPTVGQQLIDLQKAKDAGAITDAEYQAQKTKLLNK